MSQAVEARVIKVRKQHPTWGAKKIRDWLAPRKALKKVPARSTIEEILRRHGLVSARKRRRRASPSSHPLAHALALLRRRCQSREAFYSYQAPGFTSGA